MNGLYTTILVLGGACVVLCAVIEREEERRELYELPTPGLDDLEPTERKLAVRGYGAAQALLTALAFASDATKEEHSHTATEARRLAALHLELVRAGQLDDPRVASIPAELEAKLQVIRGEEMQDA